MANDSLDNARSGYNAAINLIIYEGSTIWAKFSAMVYTHTILIAAIGLIITSSNAPNLSGLKMVLSILGLCLCGSWFFLTKRSYDYYKYWILSAREIEELYLTPVTTVSRGASFSNGDSVDFKTKPPISHQLNKRLPEYKIEDISYFIMIIFSIVYLIMLFY